MGASRRFADRPPATLATRESLLDSLKRRAAKPRTRTSGKRVARAASVAPERPRVQPARMVAPAADIVSWEGAGGSGDRVAVPGPEPAPPAQPAPEPAPAAQPAPTTPPPTEPATAPPETPPPAPASPSANPAPSSPPGVVAGGLPFIEAGSYPVHELGDLVSDEEVERAVERIRNPRSRRDPGGAVLDGFLQELSRGEPRAAPPRPEPSLPLAPSGLPVPEPPPARPLSARDMDMAAVAGVAAVTQSGPGSAPAAPAPSGPVSAPAPPPATPAAPIPVFDITASVGQGGRNLPADVRALSTRLIALGFNWLTLDDQVNADKIAAIKLFQAIKNGHATVAGSKENDGLVEVGKDTHRWLQATNAPRWQVMPAGSASEGFENSERADIASTYDYGTDWLAAAIAGAGAAYKRDWRDGHPGAALLTVNDTSLPRGVPQPGETVEHAGHQTGLELDLRLPRTDGAAGDITHTDQLYDRDAMRAILTALRAQPVRTVLFNDPTLIAEGLCTHWEDHDDHAHVRIRPPALGPVVTAMPASP